MQHRWRNDVCFLCLTSLLLITSKSWLCPLSSLYLAWTTRAYWIFGFLLLAPDVIIPETSARYDGRIQYTVVHDGWLFHSFTQQISLWNNVRAAGISSYQPSSAPPRGRCAAAGRYLDSKACLIENVFWNNNWRRTFFFQPLMIPASTTTAGLWPFCRCFGRGYSLSCILYGYNNKGSYVFDHVEWHKNPVLNVCQAS